MTDEWEKLKAWLKIEDGMSLNSFPTLLIADVLAKMKRLERSSKPKVNPFAAEQKAKQNARAKRKR